MNKNFERLINYLYEIKDAFIQTFKDKDVIKWIATAIITYGLPAFYRAITRNPNLPYLPILETGNEYIPGSRVEKLIANPIAPGGAGAKIVKTFIEKIRGKKVRGLRKCLSRIFGPVTTSAWTSIQYLGYNLCDALYEWPSGGNPFEPPSIYPFNLFIAISIAPLVSYAVDYLKERIKKRRS